ncbi:response regulator [Egicoccus halophilus]|uniref:Response regulator n=1 Tax=Egicoccus halophilus TaxID=1670830 RepID=A0A8J3AH46_9ACTN|nr:response regulator [Egicoccus halophilus]GGI09609.1 response regulator [Egicoccus halophilus]
MTPHVLIVDDEDAIRMVARLGLERVAGWSVTEAGSAVEAAAAVGTVRPDVVLLDVMMPVEDGPQTLERLRALPGGADLRVLFLTAKAQRSEIERLRALGVDGVISKPFDPMTLAGDIAGLLGWDRP